MRFHRKSTCVELVVVRDVALHLTSFRVRVPAAPEYEYDAMAVQLALAERQLILASESPHIERFGWTLTRIFVLVLRIAVIVLDRWHSTPLLNRQTHRPERSAA